MLIWRDFAGKFGGKCLQKNKIGLWTWGYRLAHVTNSFGVGCQCPRRKPMDEKRKKQDPKLVSKIPVSAEGNRSWLLHCKSWAATYRCRETSVFFFGIWAFRCDEVVKIW